MELDLDTFLTLVYCMVDDLYQQLFAAGKPPRRGHRPEMSDSEVLCLGILAQWQQNRSERAFLNYAVRHLQEYFPHWPTQSTFNRRMRDLSGVLCSLGPALAQRSAAELGLHPAYEVLDAVPVPLLRRCRADQQRQFADEAAIGVGGADKDWFFGMKLLISITPEGLITGFIEGAANTDERWLAEALLRWRRNPEAPPPRLEDLAETLGPTHLAGGERKGPSGPLAPYLGAGQDADGPYLGDLGYCGEAWYRHWRQDYQAMVLTKADYAEVADLAGRREGRHWVSSHRQVVETAFHWLTHTFGVRYPRARTYWGVLTRLGAKIAAFNVLAHLNHLFGRPPFAQFCPL